MTKIPLKMNADRSYSSMSTGQKRERLMDLVERKRSVKRPVPKQREREHDTTDIKNSEKESVKQKILNGHFYKKLFQIQRKKVNVSNGVNDTRAEKSCSGSRRKKRRLCFGQRCGESVHKSSTKDKIQSGRSQLADFQFEVSTEIQNHVLPYVNKLRDHRNRGQNAVFIDGLERVVKVVAFVSSLLDNMKKPILIIASSSAVSLWEVEFSKWSKSVNVVTYKGNKDTRAAIRGSEIQVLLSSLDAIVEDMKMFVHIKWELLVIDECQRPIFSMHLKEIQMLMADMKLLTVSGKPVDICQSYKNILSMLDQKCEKTHTDAEMEMKDDISTLKEKLSPFIAFEFKFSTPDLDEYWVPAHLSSMQTEQYRSILVSNSDALSSSSRTTSLNDVITQIQKCCDHPYLVDPTLRNSLKEDSLTDSLAAEINVSGKLHVFDKLLLEIKQCGLRVLVLFHPAVNSEKISTGHFLDDLVHQRFGERSYVYIPRRNRNSYSSNFAYVKKKEALEMFNNAGSDRFVCLCDYRDCHSSIRLSRLDVVILFNSDHNPSNDIKALKRITIDPHHEQLNVFRLYSTFTVEEKALILSKQGTTLDSYISWRACQQLLGWGTSYVFGKLQICIDSGPQSFIGDLIHELSSLLRNTSVETGPTRHSLVSYAQMQNGDYSECIMLFGENETGTHTKETTSIDDYLIDNRQSVFWNKLVKESQSGPEKSCSRLSRRVQKSTPNWFEGEDATPSSFVRSKPRSKRKLLKNIGRKWARAHRPFGTHQACETMTPSSISDSRTIGGQQSQNEEPPPHTLETEIERIQKEREQIAKSHKEKESMLLAECEKEISEVRKKYDGLIHDSKARSTNEDRILEDYQKLVNANKLLAEILAQNWQDSVNLNRTQKETTAVNILQIPASAHILQIPASALVRPKNPCLTSGPTAHLPGRSLTGQRFPAPHLRSKPSLFGSLHNRPATGEPSLPTLSTTQTVNKHCPV